MVVPINIIIADNQYLITESFKSIFKEDNRFSIKKVAKNKIELFDALKTELVSLLILDFIQIECDISSDLKLLKEQYPCVAILVITNSINKNELIELNNINVNNIVFKTADKSEFFTAVESAIHGKRYYPQSVLEMLFDLSENREIHKETEKQLTCSEIDIVRLISDGYTTKQIATKKNISVHTVMSHRKNIFRKLCVNNASELIMHAIKLGIIESIEYNI